MFRADIGRRSRAASAVLRRAWPKRRAKAGACVGDAGFAYVGVYSDHVNVDFFLGALLNDPARLLEGTGRRGRHVKLWPGRGTNERALADLITAAYEDMRRRVLHQGSSNSSD